MINHLMDCFIVFAGALVLTLILTPIVREFNRSIGMVDKPDERRINKVAIPRGGGLALFLGVIASFSAFLWLHGSSATTLVGGHSMFWRITLLAGIIVTIGYIDDKFSLRPLVKLAGQIAVAALTWGWAGLGFSDIWPSIPAWLDCVITICWIIGAINAFNLIDGLDGLASGLGLIASVGMVGALFFSGKLDGTLFYFAFAGGLLGFLRYNFNPASVFLGDSGSMYIGYALAALPLCSHTADSFLVSIGVPLLGMGVPIFDTSLAIIRRSIRHLLKMEGEESGNGKVMTADTDHLHHRILRSVGLNQRKAAYVLYAMAAFLVAVGMIALTLQSKAGGLWLGALAIGAFIIFRDMSRIELFDAGRLIEKVVHTQNQAARRRWSSLAIPMYMLMDIVALVAGYFVVVWALKLPVSLSITRNMLMVRAVPVLAALVFLRAYNTIWARAMPSNYARLVLACVLGSAIGSIIIYYAPTLPVEKLKIFTIAYAMITAFSVIGIRIVRPLARDFFYGIDCRQMVSRKDVSRILIYGTGLRYRAFRRELVRSSTKSSRISVGLLDDDQLLRGHYIGGLRVLGTLEDAPAKINEFNVDCVVVAFQATPERLEEIKRFLAPTGVKVMHFDLSETAL